MKKFYAIALFLNIAFLGYGQLDTSFQNTTIEYGFLEDQQLVDAKKHYLQLQQDEKYLWKFGFAGTILPSEHPIDEYPHLSFSNTLFIAYEYRLKNGFSLNTTLDYNRATFTTIRQIHTYFTDSYLEHRYGFAIEPRYYIGKQQKIAKGVSGDNLNGIYVSLLAGAKYWQKLIYSSDSKKSYFKGSYQYSILNLGWQRRFGQRGFIHIQLGTGIQHNPQDTLRIGPSNYPREISPLSKWKMISTYRIGLGLAINKKNDTNVKENIWTYHQTDRDMWTIDLFGLLLSLEDKVFGNKINIGYERGSPNASFSISTNIVYLRSYRYWINELSLQIAPRYYYNLKKRIKRVKLLIIYLLTIFPFAINGILMLLEKKVIII